MKRRARTLFDGLSLDSPHVTEARRLLQTLARQEREAGLDKKVYMVTSASRAEGKSTICGLVAIVAAKIFRKKTIVIDADFRRPSLHTLLGCTHTPGLAEVMEGAATLESVTRPTTIPTLFAIPSGKSGRSAGETYDDEAFQKVLRTLRAEYDLIFVDCPPVVPVLEPLLIAEHVDSLLLVAMAGQTPINMIRRMKSILAPVERKIAGAILNNAIEGLPYYYDYRYYGYDRPKARRFRASRTGGPDSGSAPRQVARQRGGD
jgi:capsular exopolysaccharide synthesis family protein